MQRTSAATTQLCDFVVAMPGEIICPLRKVTECAEAIKKIVPNRKHFEYMCENRGHLVEEYRQCLDIHGQDILKIYGLMAEKIRELYRQPLENVEKDLVGYAALLEEEILRQYGGVREIVYETGNIVISEVG